MRRAVAHVWSLMPNANSPKGILGRRHVPPGICPRSQSLVPVRTWATPEPPQMTTATDGPTKPATPVTRAASTGDANAFLCVCVCAFLSHCFCVVVFLHFFRRVFRAFSGSRLRPPPPPPPGVLLAALASGWVDDVPIYVGRQDPRWPAPTGRPSMARPTRPLRVKVRGGGWRVVWDGFLVRGKDLFRLATLLNDGPVAISWTVG